MIDDELERMFPASAGMIPPSTTGTSTPKNVPRKRGDDPTASAAMASAGQCSPQARG